MYKSDYLLKTDKLQKKDPTMDLTGSLIFNLKLIGPIV